MLELINNVSDYKVKNMREQSKNNNKDMKDSDITLASK